MKGALSFILLCVLCISMHINFTSAIDPRWRRAEFILSGFKDSLARGYGRIRRNELTINGAKTFIRQLKSNPVETDIDDDFIWQYVVNNYDPSFNADNYFYPDPDLIPTIFENPLTFRFFAYYEDASGARVTIVDATTVVDYRCAANADRLIRDIQLSPEVKVDLYVSFRCHGYNGLGCRFLCDVGGDVPYECLYDTNQQICKNPNFNNPPACNLNDTRCLVNPCLNGAQCVRVSNTASYCICAPGFMGDTCSIFICETPCDPDFGSCTGPNTCTCSLGWGGPLCNQATCNVATNPCFNNGTCAVVRNEVICECDPSRFAGSRCEIECVPSCVFGTCVQLINSAVCQCFEGFIGTSCNETIPEPQPIFEEGYLSIRQQRIIYVGVSAGLILIAIIVFGIGSYQRTHKKRNMRVLKGAQTAMKTLQLNQQFGQTLTNNQMGQFGGQVQPSRL